MLKNLLLTPNNILLIALVVVIFIVPVFSVSSQLLAYNICFTVILLMSALSLKWKKKNLIFIAAIIIIAIEWLASVLDREGLSEISRGLKIPFFILMVIGLIYQTATAKKVMEQVIVDSISGYLLLGIVFVLAVIAVNNAIPQAYYFPYGKSTKENFAEHFSDFFYYTFITYTSTGYGDILPIASQAKSLSIFIAAAGQLYVAIIIALLVGKFAGEKGNSY